MILEGKSANISARVSHLFMGAFGMATTIRLQINQHPYTIDADPQTSLLTVLREHLDLTGSKYGCGEGQCGACTVLIDGKAQRSCITKVGTVAQKQITTIEGLASGDRLHPVQEAFLEEGAMQCAYCTSGMIMSAVALLKKNPAPKESEIIEFMDGNVCRCGTYPRIVSAIQKAAGVMAANKEGRLAPIATQTAGRGAVAPPGPSTRAECALARDDKALGEASRGSLRSFAAQTTLAQDDNVLETAKVAPPGPSTRAECALARDDNAFAVANGRAL
jgi:aerobic-type carbon monoxide dehydrogenase small subunit (CoxS/CutS family)